MTVVTQTHAIAPAEEAQTIDRFRSGVPACFSRRRASVLRRSHREAASSVPAAPWGQDASALWVEGETDWFAGALVSLSRDLESKDVYTWGHCQRVGALAAQMAIEHELSAPYVREIRLGATLHDIGKVGVPDAILTKSTALSAAEYERMMQHTIIGESLLLPFLPDHPIVLQVARWHHERYDGRGRPDGLRGDEIPLAARIVSVADAFDAMTSPRPYRAALARDTAVSEIVDHAGMQFDANCVRALLAIVARAEVDGEGADVVPIRPIASAQHLQLA